MVYSDRPGRGGTGLVPDDDERRRQAGGVARDDQQRAYDEEFARIAEQQHYDDEFARIAEAEGRRSQLADQVMREQHANALGRPAGGSTNTDEGTASARQPTGAAGGQSGDDSRDNLFRRESDAGGGYYRQEDKAEKKEKKSFLGNGKFVSNPLSQGRRILAIFGILAGLIGGITGLLQFAVSPFQVPSLAQFLEDKKYAVFNNGADKFFERALTHYIASVLLPGMRENGCTTTKIDRNCARVMRGEGPVRLLYRKWSGADSRLASLERKLALQGIEISSNSVRGQYFMRSPTLGNPIPLDDVENGRVSNMFDMKEMSSEAVKAEFRRIIERETGFKKLMFRMRVGALLKKHGIIRCAVTCVYGKKLNGSIRDKKLAGIALLSRRIEGRSQVLALYINCLITPCSEEITSDGTVRDEATMGEPQDQIRRDTRAMLSRYSADFGGDKLNDLVKRIEGLDRDGLSLHFTKLAIEKIGGAITGRQISAEIVSKAAGPVGWIAAALRLALLLDSLQQLKTMNSRINSALFVQTSSLLTTVGHEVRANQMELAILGSFSTLLNYGPFRTGPGMTESPAYQATVASLHNSPTAAFMRTFLPQKAHAQTLAGAEAGVSAGYKCSDGKSIFAHQVSENSVSNYTCRETRLGLDDAFIDNSNAVLTGIPGMSTILAIARPISALLNAVSGFVQENILRAWLGIANYETIQGLITSITAPMLEAFLNIFIKNPYADDPAGVRLSGARIFEGAIAGFEIGGADSAHRLLGGGILTSADLTAIRQEEEGKLRSEFAAMPLRDRLFSLDSSYSLKSQLAIMMPSDMGGAARRGFASLLSNPLHKLAGSVASVFTLRQVQAQDFVAQPSMFDVVQHGYRVDDPAFKADPIEYWDRECADGLRMQAYNTDRNKVGGHSNPRLSALIAQLGWVLDDRTNEVVNPVPEPCFGWYTLGHFDEEPAVAGAATGGAVGAAPTSCNGATLVANFDGGVPEDYGYAQELAGGGLTIVNNPVRAGTGALKAQLTGGEVRAQQHLDKEINMRQQPGAVGTFCHSIMIPSGNGNVSSWWVLMQWHSPPWNGSPPIALEARNDQFLFAVNGNTSHGSMPLKKDTWYDFTWQIKFSSGGDGSWTVFASENGAPAQQVAQYNGPTMHGSHASIHPMVTNYSAGGNQRPLVVYHDEVKFISGTAGP